VNVQELYIWHVAYIRVAKQEASIISIRWVWWDICPPGCQVCVSTGRKRGLHA